MRRTALAALLALVLAPVGASADARGLEVALASAPDQAPVCRSLDAELRSIGVAARLLEAPLSAAEASARSSGATVLVLCEADPARIVIRFLDGSWPTDPAYVLAVEPDAIEAAILDTSEWLRARLTAAAAAPAPAAPAAADDEAPPLPAWRRPYAYFGTLHDPIAQPRFLLPFLALGAGFFPIRGLHVFGQFSSQVYRIEGEASGVGYRLAADHGHVGAGYLQLIRRGHVGVLADARLGVLRLRARGEDGPNVLGRDAKVWNPIVLVGFGLFARTRGPVAFRAIAAFRTQLRDVEVYVADRHVRTSEAHGYALQWQMEVAL